MTTLLEFLLRLLTDPELREEFLDDPEAVLAENGLDDLDLADAQDAVVLVEDNQYADFSRNYDTGGNTAAVVGDGMGGGHEAAVQFLSTYVTRNFADDRDFIADSSINQQIDTGGGDFDQDIDLDEVFATGAGAVAAGGDIEGSAVVTGDGNQIGSGNVAGDGNVVGSDNMAVSGSGNTVAFGTGSAVSTEIDDVEVGAGGAFAIGGDAQVDNSDNSLTNVGNDSSDNSLTNVGNDNSDNSLTNVGNDNSDNSSDDDTTVTDSGNLGVDVDVDLDLDGVLDILDPIIDVDPILDPIVDVDPILDPIVDLDPVLDPVPDPVGA